MTHIEFRSALKALGITQREFARRLGVSELTVGRWCGMSGGLPVPGYAVYVLELLQKAHFAG